MMFDQAIFRRLLVFSAILSTTALVARHAHGDLQIAGYQDRLHDPFYVGSDKAFIGAAYRWSGYGRWEDPAATGGSNWKHVAMISDNYFLTANHNRPLLGDDPAGVMPKVRFYRTTDPNGEYWESEIAVEGAAYAGARIGSTDLWVGKLANTPPSWVMRYPLAKRQEATNYLSYTDNDIFVFGQDSPRSATSVRVGRNEVNRVSSYGTFQWDYDPVAGLGADEAQTQSGDSGGPSFFANERIPVLAGIHYRVNYDTGVSKYLQQISDAVGEPISFSTGLLGDVDGDFRVGIADLGVLAASFGVRKDAKFSQGDLTGDGIVDLFDLMAFVNNYGKTLYAPSDFDFDGDVDGNDLATIGGNWLKSVTKPSTMGDANGDSFVNLTDVEMFDRNQFRAFFGPLPAPLAPIAGDMTGNGIVDGLDLNVVTLNLNQTVVPGTNGDADGNGHVDDLDTDYITARLGDSFGDVDGDHLVGPADFLILASNWNRTVSGGRLSGDFNGDAIVNGLDANTLFGWWGQKGGTFSSMTVPEPTSIVLFCLAFFGSAGVVRCRHRPAAYVRRLTFPLPC
jgi:hypothetical protein